MQRYRSDSQNLENNNIKLGKNVFYQILRLYCDGPSDFRGIIRDCNRAPRNEKLK